MRDLTTSQDCRARVLSWLSTPHLQEAARSTESTISVLAPVVTLINVFTVEPARQPELVQLLVTATEEVMQYQPGFVSANIHASTDGERVVNYAQGTANRP